MAEVEFLKQKAEEFLASAKDNNKKGRYNSAALDYHQACELYLKYYLFQKLADFPKVHRISLLLEDIGVAYDEEDKINDFLTEKNGLIEDLEEAYIQSRYMPVHFDKDKLDKIGELSKEIIKLIKSL